MAKFSRAISLRTMRGAGAKLSTLSMVIAMMAIAPSREASAQPRPVLVAAAPRAAPSTPRFRLGAGTHGGYARFGVGSAAAWLLAGYVRAGAQVSDVFAIDAQFAGGWLGLMSYARANVYADFTVASRVSLAVGPTYSQGAFSGGSGSVYEDRPSNGGPSPTRPLSLTRSPVAWPAIVGPMLQARELHTPPRRAFSRCFHG